MAVENKDSSFSIGNVFSRTFGVMGRNPLVVFGVTFLLWSLPFTLLSYGLAQLRLDMQDRNTMFGAIGSGIILAGFAVLLRAIIQGCLVRAAVADSEGRQASLGECFTVAAARALPLIGVSFLFVLGIAVGFALLIVPGIMFAVACAVVAPVVVEERVGVIEAFGRASVLTRGARWKIFGLALLVIILIWLVEAILGFFMIVSSTPFANPTSPAMILFNLIPGTLLGAFTSLIQTSLYVELRAWKDGPASPQLSEIFA